MRDEKAFAHDIYAVLVSGDNLSTTEKLIEIYMRTRDALNYSPSVAHDTIAIKLSLSKSTVRRSIRKLCHENRLTISYRYVEGHGQQSSTYGLQPIVGNALRQTGLDNANEMSSNAVNMSVIGNSHVFSYGAELSSNTDVKDTEQKIIEVMPEEEQPDTAKLVSENGEANHREIESETAEKERKRSILQLVTMARKGLIPYEEATTKIKAITASAPKKSQPVKTPCQKVHPVVTVEHHKQSFVSNVIYKNNITDVQKNDSSIFLNIFQRLTDIGKKGDDLSRLVAEIYYSVTSGVWRSTDPTVRIAACAKLIRTGAWKTPYGFVA